MSCIDNTMINEMDYIKLCAVRGYDKFITYLDSSVEYQLINEDPIIALNDIIERINCVRCIYNIFCEEILYHIRPYGLILEEKFNGVTETLLMDKKFRAVYKLIDQKFIGESTLITKNDIMYQMRSIIENVQPDPEKIISPNDEIMILYILFHNSSIVLYNRMLNLMILHHRSYKLAHEWDKEN